MSVRRKIVIMLHISIWKRTGILVLVALALSISAIAQSQEELQRLLDSSSMQNTRADGWSEIDLSKYTEPITSTLYVRKQNVRFVNGTLRVAETLNGPLVEISGGYGLDVAPTASLSGNNVTTDTIVKVVNGVLEISGGSIVGTVYNGVIPEFLGTQPADRREKSATPASLVSDNARLLLNSGTMEGQITCSAENADIQLLGGEVKWVEAYQVSTRSALHLMPSSCSLVFTTRGKQVHLKGAVADSLRIDYDGYLEAGDCIAAGEDYTITQADVDRMSVHYAFWEYGIPHIDPPTYVEGSRHVPAGYSYHSEAIPFRLVLKDNKVILEEVPSPIRTLLDVEPGTLATRIPEQERGDIEELTLTGRLNGSDIVVLQDMAKMKLRKLDLAGCHIVEGGASYYTISDGTGYTYNYYTANDEIGTGMFYQSTALEEVVLPWSVKTINGSCFHYGSLKSITIGPSVTTISGGLCPGTKLEEIVLDGNTSFVVEDGILYNTAHTTIYRAVASVAGEVDIVKTVTVVENSAFENCEHLTKVVLPPGLKEVETASFADCPALREVVFNDALTRTGYNSFSSCAALTKVDLSNTHVDYIYGSFWNCNNIDTLLLPKTLATIWGNTFLSKRLKYINCQATTPPTLTHADNTFAYSSIKATCELVVPQGCVDKYKAAAGWKNFYNITDGTLNTKGISSEDELQKLLDGIAEQNPTKAVEVTIADQGLWLTKTLSVPMNCKVRISGGPITLNQSFNEDFVFMIYGELILDSIKIDFSYYTSELRHGFLIDKDGSLAIIRGVEFVGVRSNSGTFYYNCGHLDLGGGKLPPIDGYTIINAGTSSWAFVDGDLFEQARIYNSSNSWIAVNSAITGIWTFLGDWDNYQLETPFVRSHYTLQPSDYWQMRFKGLPTADRTVYYDDSRHSVQLKDYYCLQCELDGSDDGEINVDCEGLDAAANVTFTDRLQWELDGGGCPEAKPDEGLMPEIRLPGGCAFFEAVVSVADITFNSFSSGHRVYVRDNVVYKQNVSAKNFIVFTIVEKNGHLTWQHARTENVLVPIYNDGGVVDVIGGRLEGTTYNLQGGTMSLSDGVSTDTIRNEGTLYLDGSVTTKEIKLGLQSKLLITSSIKSAWVISVLTNDSDATECMAGLIIMQGTDGYKLTRADMGCIDINLPDGYSLVLDEERNAIVAYSPEQLQGIADAVVDTASKTRVYDLQGRMVSPRGSSSGIYIQKGRKVVKNVKRPDYLEY